MTNKAPGVVVGNAAKIAADVTFHALQLGTPPGEFIAHYADVLDAVLALMADRTEDSSGPAAPTAPSAQQRVENAFPGTTVVQQPGPAVAPPPSAAPAVQNAVPASAPAPIPGAQDGDPALAEAWTQFFSDIGDGTFANKWEDNRGLKAQGGKYAKIPDFKHKSWQRPGDRYPVGVYIDDKKNPSWVGQQLAAHGVAS